MEEPEASPTPDRPRRRRQTLIAGAAGLALLVTAVMASVATRSGAKAPRAAAPPPAATATTPPAPVTTAPPTTAPPPPTTVAPPPTIAAPASVPPPPPPAPRPAPPPKAAAPPVPLTFAARLDQALGTTPGCLVVEQDGVTTFERNPTVPFVPASSQKLMVGAALLSRLGPDFRFQTQVVAPQRPGDGGRLDDAWLVGAGDPYLATPDYVAYAASKPRLITLPLTPLTALADALVVAGVRDIPGGLHADESRYDTQRSVPTWKPSYVRAGEVGSLGALTVNEGLASWGPNQRVAPDPAASATGALTRLLHDRGVAAAPGPAPESRVSAPAGAVVVASVRSAPLADIVAAMMRASDNYAAEMLLRELDRQTGGTGTTAGGGARVVVEMGQAGVSTEGVHLNDGSGLDVGNRSTCRGLLGALALSSRPGLSAVADGLAVAGRTGTLVKRFLGTPAEGRLAAKTGWISGAGALVGRLDGQPSRRFALLVNGNFGYATVKAIQDRVVTVLATAP